ncbi:hypothetical protein LJR225_003703 [Phenylobacterium sp. LjRoot225]
MMADLFRKKLKPRQDEKSRAVAAARLVFATFSSGQRDPKA